MGTCSSEIKSLLDHHKTASESQRITFTAPKLHKAVLPRKSSLEILNRRTKVSAKQKVQEVGGG